VYAPAEVAPGVYDELMSAGAALGVVDAGYYTIESLRLEKGYRAFGRELTPDHSPVEAGLLFACKLRTDVDFLGRAAVEAARDAGPRRRLVSLVVDDPEPMLWGGELVLRDGAAVGQVTSAAWGETLGSCVGLAYVADPSGAATADWVRAGSYALDVGGSVHPVTVGLRAPYDPDGLRVRG
jgi:4-methylaminobutanoate oxidase (formaldehyde-forming)